MKKVILLLSILINIPLNAQTKDEAKKVLETVKNLNEIKVIKKKHPDWLIFKDKTYYSDSLNFPEVVHAYVGDIVPKILAGNNQYLVKILAVKNLELSRVSYIYLDGRNLSKQKIDSIRHLIIKKYKNGEDFVKLVQQFSMDSNETGDTGWFSKGVMIKEFENAVWSHQKNDIFTVDFPKKSWYHVVLKTHPTKNEKTAIGIAIKHQPDKSVKPHKAYNPTGKTMTPVVFPGCENVMNKRNCMSRKIQTILVQNLFKTLKFDKDFKTYVRFKVNRQGKVDNVEVKNGNNTIKAEIVRIIKALPKMSPGLVKGNPVNVTFTLPLIIRVEK